MPKKRTVGWEAWRYGRNDAPKPQPRPIFNKDKRRHVIDRLFDAMRDWRFSPFQYEGQTRAHLRSVLCLAGYGWERSDAEATYLVGEVLKGFPRPSWSEGQLSYTASITVCKGCGGPLDEYEIANGIRFCCDECRRISKNKTIGLATGFIEIGPTKCLNPGCPNVFYPTNALQLYCCHPCSIEGKALQLPERECAWCNTPFPPKNDQAQYCSPKCNQRAKDARRKEERQAARQERVCPHCNGRFYPKRKDAVYCSESHRRAAEYVRLKKAKAA